MIRQKGIPSSLHIISQPVNLAQISLKNIKMLDKTCRKPVGQVRKLVFVIRNDVIEMTQKQKHMKITCKSQVQLPLTTLGVEK